LTFDAGLLDAIDAAASERGPTRLLNILRV